MHALESASNFNESMYFNVYDPAERVGGFLRLGNRANEGYAEMTTCLYLPDGRVGFMFNRPEIADNDAFDAGGTRFEVVDAVRGAAHHLRRQGRAARPSRSRWRTRARRSPRTRGSTRTSSSTHRGRVADVRRRARERRRLPALRDHSGRLRPRPLRAAHGGRRASIRVGDEEWEVDGFGLRDHSWGPRFWQAPWWYRWLTANFGDGLRLRGLDHRVARRRPALRRHRAAQTARTSTSDARDDRDRLERRRRVPPGGARHRDDRRPTPTRSPGRCSTSSRCATAARRPTASSS